MAINIQLTLILLIAGVIIGTFALMWASKKRKLKDISFKTAITVAAIAYSINSIFNIINQSIKQPLEDAGLLGISLLISLIFLAITVTVMIVAIKKFYKLSWKESWPVFWIWFWISLLFGIILGVVLLFFARELVTTGAAILNPF